MTRMVGAFATGWIVFFGSWTAIALACIALGRGLTVATLLIPLPVIAGLAAARGEFRFPPRPLEEGGPPAPLRVTGPMIIAALALGALPFARGALPWAWALAALPLLGAVILDRTQPEPARTENANDPQWAAVCLGATIVLALAVTILSNRPDADDQRYLWMSLHLLRHPGDAMFGLLTIQSGREEVYAWHPYEILVAVLARVSGIGAPYHYYYTLPALSALMTVAESYLTARLFVGRLAALTALICVLLLIAGGETPRGFGNFAFVRLFQGKAALATWAATAVFRHAMRFGQERLVWTATTLAAAILCAIGHTHSAVAIVPLAALAGIVAGWPGRSRLAIPLVVTGAALAAYGVLRLAALLIGFVLVRRADDPSHDFPLVFPPDYRSALILASMALAGALLPAVPGRMARRAALVGVALSLNPVVMSILSRAIWSLSWRVFWSFPFILFAGITLTAGGLREYKAWRLPLLSILALAAFLYFGQWTTAASDGNNFGDAGLKIDRSQPDWLDTDELTRP